MSSLRNIYVGYDPREVNNFVVCTQSAKEHLSKDVRIRGLTLATLRRQGLYSRPASINEKGQLFDTISQAPMSSEFANSRFLVPHLQEDGLALFVDCDTMFLRDPNALFDLMDPSKAVMCVKHNHQPKEETKKNGEIQTRELDPRFPGRYIRKNWSSVMLWNLDHPSNKKLTVEQINTLPGRDLHALFWLEEDEIGELPVTWNYLVGVNEMPDEPINLVHWTLGSPAVVARENTIFFDEYHHILNTWAVRGGGF